MPFFLFQHEVSKMTKTGKKDITVLVEKRGRKVGKTLQK